MMPCESLGTSGSWLAIRPEHFGDDCLSIFLTIGKGGSAGHFSTVSLSPMMIPQ